MNDPKLVFTDYRAIITTSKWETDTTFVLTFMLYLEQFEHEVVAFDDTARALITLFKNNKFPQLEGGIKSWTQGIRHPDTGELILYGGGQVLVPAVMFYVDKIKE